MFTQADPLEVATKLWAASAEPVDSVRAGEAFLGLTPAAARLTAAVVLTTSPEVDELVASLPHMMRKLTVATNMRTERLFGEIRGPVVWNETLAARAASAGDPQLFVCSSVRRAYDTPENRVLVGALLSITSAGVLVERQGLRKRNSGLARHIRHNAGVAMRFLDHRALNGVQRHPDRRDIMRARSGKNRGRYVHALAVLKRASSPIRPDHVAALGSPRTQAQHAALLAVIEALHRRGIEVPAMRPLGGTMTGRPITYVHDDLARRAGRPAGIHVGDLLLDVPVAADGTEIDGEEALRALAERADGRQCAIVRDPGDVEWALDEAGYARSASSPSSSSSV